jgi:HD-GYP domain-containing protein (c-di-GMP phosphodiesterase class II)
MVVWHFAGSSVTRLFRGLPPSFHLRPLHAGELPPRAIFDGALVIDLAGGDSAALAEAMARHLDVPIVAIVDATLGDPPPISCHAYLSAPVAPFVLAQALRNAGEHLALHREQERTREQIAQLNAIGVQLTAERDTDKLLELILTKARQITRSDAGSIYLVEESEIEGRWLRFKLAQNDSVDVLFTEFTLPISEDSIAGSVALSGDIVVLDDAYLVPGDSRFRINRDFDARAGYRTKSMLVVAMKTPAGEVLGVLQLINCKRDPTRPFATPEAAEQDAIPYPPAARDLAASLASQAAVAVENSRLYESIRALFEGFVQASVTAIESRDPTTSGHSFRVADFTVALAEAADRATDGPLRHLRFSPEEMREIRYASLLHDFGKVGVREEILVKAKKLHPGHLDLIRLRGEVVKRGIELKYARCKIEHLLERGSARFLEQSAAWDAELACLFADIDDQLKLVEEANEPTVIPEDWSGAVRRLALRRFVDHLGEGHVLITPEEARILSISRGSLTEEEYQQIQSHVTHTFQFLRQIPWTKELRRIPEIARGHHEKLDGSGYPSSRQADAIPVQTRMMTIADIFDALTAADRPYKAALPVGGALDILSQEAARGSLDTVLLELFIHIKPWERGSR